MDRTEEKDLFGSEFSEEDLKQNLNGYFLSIATSNPPERINEMFDLMDSDSDFQNYKSTLSSLRTIVLDEAKFRQKGGMRAGTGQTPTSAIIDNIDDIDGFYRAVVNFMPKMLERDVTNVSSSFLGLAQNKNIDISSYFSFLKRRKTYSGLENFLDGLEKACNETRTQVPLKEENPLYLYFKNNLSSPNFDKFVDTFSNESVELSNFFAKLVNNPQFSIHGYFDNLKAKKEFEELGGFLSDFEDACNQYKSGDENAILDFLSNKENAQNIKIFRAGTESLLDDNKRKLSDTSEPTLSEPKENSEKQTENKIEDLTKEEIAIAIADVEGFLIKEEIAEAHQEEIAANIDSLPDDELKGELLNLIHKIRRLKSEEEIVEEVEKVKKKEVEKRKLDDISLEVLESTCASIINSVRERLKEADKQEKTTDKAAPESKDINGQENQPNPEKPLDKKEEPKIDENYLKRPDFEELTKKDRIGSTLRLFGLNGKPTDHFDTGMEYAKVAIGGLIGGALFFINPLVGFAILATLFEPFRVAKDTLPVLKGEKITNSVSDYFKDRYKELQKYMREGYLGEEAKTKKFQKDTEEWMKKVEEEYEKVQKEKEENEKSINNPKKPAVEQETEDLAKKTPEIFETPEKPLTPEEHPEEHPEVIPQPVTEEALNPELPPAIVPKHRIEPNTESSPVPNHFNSQSLLPSERAALLASGEQEESNEQNPLKRIVTGNVPSVNQKKSFADEFNSRRLNPTTSIGIGNNNS